MDEKIVYPSTERIDDKTRYEIVSEELKRFNKLVKGHKKLLYAIGNL